MKGTSRYIKMDKLNFQKYYQEDAAKLQEQAIEAIREDDDVSAYIRENLHLTQRQVKENLAVRIDFQDDFKYGKNCPGFDRCEKAQPHYKMSLSLDGPFVKREFCICDLAKEVQMRKAKYLHCDYPESWGEITIADIDRSKSRAPIINALLAAAAGEKKRWLYLHGEPKSGKSYLLAAMTNTFSINNYPVAYFDCANFIETLKDLAFSKEKHAKEALNKAISNYSRCPLLVLDGFGNEFKSEYVFSAILYPILSARSNADLLTCFASDFTIEEVIGEYKNKIGGLRSKQFLQLMQKMTKEEIVVPPNIGLY